MFIGEYQHTIDCKGRLIIPTHFREGLTEKFILTKGLDNCLFAYPPAEWIALENKMRALPLNKADARAFIRFFFAGACECSFDRQGRILIPANLRNYAGLEREIMVTGASMHVEIWAKERWDLYTAEVTNKITQLAESLMEF